MQEEAIKSGNADDMARLSAVQHIFFEVGKELLSKPNALCDYLEAEGLPSTMVFCNSPSDADFVDVMLRKRGIASQKLIGFVPKQKLDQAILDFKTGSLTALVVTDIGARGIDQSNVDTVISYSVPTDHDLYAQRSGLFKHIETEGPDGEKLPPAEPKLKKMISILGALDVANFHYLRKAYEFEFVEGQVPASEKISEGKYVQLQRLANEHTASEMCQKMAERVLNDANRDKIVTLLVSNTMEVLPSLRAMIGRDEVQDDGDYQDDDDNIGQQEQFRNDRRGGRGRDRDARQGRDNRGDRRERGNDRGDRGNRRGRDRDDDTRFGGNDERAPREPRQRREPRPYTPPAKEVRLYVGSGSKSNFTREKLMGILSEQCSLGEDSIKRVSVRPGYTFFDVAEEHANSVTDKLGDASGLFIKRAITLNAAREQTQSNDTDARGQYDDGDNEGGRDDFGAHSRDQHGNDGHRNEGHDDDGRDESVITE